MKLLVPLHYIVSQYIAASLSSMEKTDLIGALVWPGWMWLASDCCLGWVLFWEEGSGITFQGPMGR